MDTTFVNNSTVIVADWLNEINDHVWHDTAVAGTTVHDSDKIKNIPSGNISATNIQDAINELDTEKEPADATILKSASIGVTVQSYSASASQAEMEAGTESALRAVSPLRVAQAISSLALSKQIQPSMVRLNTSNGYGSTNTAIRRFTTTVSNQGSDITYADSATLGASFTINTNGVYSISYTELFNAAYSFGISINSTQRTTSIVSITTADRLCMATTFAADSANTIGISLYLPSGSVIRPHTAGSTALVGSLPAVAQFTISRTY